MKLTDAQVAAVLPHFQRAVAALAQCWDSQRAIERELGRDFNSMTYQMEPWVLTLDDEGALTEEDVREYIESLKEDR